MATTLSGVGGPKSNHLCLMIATLIALVVTSPLSLAQGTRGQFPDPVSSAVIERFFTTAGFTPEQRAPGFVAFEKYLGEWKELRDNEVTAYLTSRAAIDDPSDVDAHKKLAERRVSLFTRIQLLDDALSANIAALATASQKESVNLERLAWGRRRDLGVLATGQTMLFANSAKPEGADLVTIVRECRLTPEDEKRVAEILNRWAVQAAGLQAKLAREAMRRPYWKAQAIVAGEAARAAAEAAQQAAEPASSDDVVADGQVLLSDNDDPFLGMDSLSGPKVAESVEFVASRKALVALNRATANELKQALAPTPGIRFWGKYLHTAYGIQDSGAAIVTAFESADVRAAGSQATLATLDAARISWDTDRTAISSELTTRIDSGSGSSSSQVIDLNHGLLMERQSLNSRSDDVDQRALRAIAAAFGDPDPTGPADPTDARASELNSQISAEIGNSGQSFTFTVESALGNTLTEAIVGAISSDSFSGQGMMVMIGGSSRLHSPIKREELISALRSRGADQALLSIAEASHEDFLLQIEQARPQTAEEPDVQFAAAREWSNLLLTKEAELFAQIASAATTEMSPLVKSAGEVRARHLMLQAPNIFPLAGPISADPVASVQLAHLSPADTDSARAILGEFELAAAAAYPTYMARAYSAAMKMAALDRVLGLFGSNRPQTALKPSEMEAFHEAQMASMNERMLANNEMEAAKAPVRELISQTLANMKSTLSMKGWQELHYSWALLAYPEMVGDPRKLTPQFDAAFSLPELSNDQIGAIAVLSDEYAVKYQAIVDAMLMARELSESSSEGKQAERVTAGHRIKQLQFERNELTDASWRRLLEIVGQANASQLKAPPPVPERKASAPLQLQIGA